MARINTPTHSDDGFDVIYDVDAVSDVSDGGVESHKNAPSSNNAGSGRLAGPHEVPQVPQAYSFDPDVAELAQQLSDQTIETFNRELDSAEREQSLVNDGLKYTKSMYNRFMSKDALIAVMGYVFRP